MNFLAIIPARYASTRFPGKPLAIVNGKPMIQRVYEQALKTFKHVCIATDSPIIVSAVKEFGGKVVLTGEHNSGTDRCLEAYKAYSKSVNIKFDTIINVQGDEPYIKPEQLEQLKECFNEDGVKLATLIKKIESKEELYNSNAPKVVIDNNNYALYFSRSPIPFPRDIELTDEYILYSKHYRHIGLYGYNSETLEQICKMPQSMLEKTEKLEQLRWLENGLKIKVKETEFTSYAVDTPEDLENINKNISE